MELAKTATIQVWVILFKQAWHACTCAWQTHSPVVCFTLLHNNSSSIWCACSGTMFSLVAQWGPLCPPAPSMLSCSSDCLVWSFCSTASTGVTLPSYTGDLCNFMTLDKVTVLILWFEGWNCVWWRSSFTPTHSMGFRSGNSGGLFHQFTSLASKKHWVCLLMC